jgi:hypothetical protein
MSLAVLNASLLVGCDAGGVGDPCLPEDEYSSEFQSYASGEVYSEMRSLSCSTRVCMVNHFQGRVSCPYGQTQTEAAENPRCFLPGTSDPVRAAVSPQLIERPADAAVYCSCRCDGPDPDARYCDCPSGFACEELVPQLGLGKKELSGSYCVREGSSFDKSVLAGGNCDRAKQNCER